METREDRIVAALREDAESRTMASDYRRMTAKEFFEKYCNESREWSDNLPDGWIITKQEIESIDYGLELNLFTS